MVLAAFMSEQMEQDLQRNELVTTGQLTQLEADVTAEAWEKVRCFLYVLKMNNNDRTNTN